MNEQEAHHTTDQSSTEKAESEKMMTTVDLKPGDIVQHPERGLNGLAVHGDGEETRVLHLTSLGIVTTTSDLDGWERVEAIRPGHVQVRIDDLEPGLSAGDDEAIRRLYLAWRKMPADEKPTSATVTLYCPECGEAENVTVVMLGRQSSGERWLGLRDSYVHTCPSRHADEPTEAGILLEIKYLRYVSIVLRGRVEYVSVDQGGIFGWSHLVDLANEMNESIKLGWG